jgi:L-ascorbate metabolism protein UlaG (beta-lactamase superfamily)
MTEKTGVDQMRITYIGGPTALIEIGRLRVITDPTFDPAGTEFPRYKKLAAPALDANQVGIVDAVLLSHDQHPDNLDSAGRAFLKRAGQVLTTSAGARRLGGNAVGLDPWQAIELDARDGRQITVTATPARHGPEGSESVTGDVVGFVLSWDQQKNGVLYISGDTVWYDGVAQVGRKFAVGTALLHMGAVQIESLGLSQLTMSAEDAARAARALHVRRLIPIHYQGWTHYRESRAEIHRAFVEAGVDQQALWLEPGEPRVIDS